jgi:hypothetical protein
LHGFTNRFGDRQEGNRMEEIGTREIEIALVHPGHDHPRGVLLEYFLNHV